MGAIRKRGKHYEIRYYDGAGRRRSEVIGPSVHEARQVLAQREWERRNGKYRLTRKGITMAEFVAKWDDDYLVVRQQLGRLKASTLVGYRNNLRLHIGPFFGRTRLDEIALPQVRDFVKALLAKQLKPATVLKAVALLKEMFKHAIQWGYLDANPAQYVERPRVEIEEMEILTPPRSIGCSPRRRSPSARCYCAQCSPGCVAASSWGSSGKTSTSRATASMSGARSGVASSSRPSRAGPGEPSTWRSR